MMRNSKLAVTCATILTLALAGATFAGAAPNKGMLMNPASLKEQAPDVFRVKFETTKGEFVVEVTRDWAPIGADHFYNLVKYGYYDGCRFFRVVKDFMAQVGINGDPEINKVLSEARIPDDPVKQSNTRGFVTFATAGPNTRSTQIFFNYADRNAALDAQGFAPFGKVVDGMEVLDKLYNEYGDGPPRGKGPDQGRMQAEGNAYLSKEFFKLDYIRRATLAKSAEKPKKESPKKTEPPANPS